MRKLILAAIFLPAPAAADFLLDVSPEQFRDWQKQIIFFDLAVGESAYFNYPLCRKGDFLFVVGDSVVMSEPYTFSANIRVTRMPNNSASVEIVTTKDGAEGIEQVREGLTRVVESGGTCERRGVQDADLAIILSINGFSSASEIVHAVDQAGDVPANP